MDTKIIMEYKLKKILKFVALFSIIVLVALLIFEYFRTRPSNVRFSNITSNSVTVSWSTKFPLSASVIVVNSENKLPFRILPLKVNQFYDTRDVKNAELSSTLQTNENISKDSSFEITSDQINSEVVITETDKYYTHHVEVQNLNPEEEYSFLVGDSLLFKKVEDLDGKSSIKTEPTPETIYTPVPAFGTVNDAQNKIITSVEEYNIVKDAIVYFNFIDSNTGEKSKLFSSPVNENGNWYVDISNARDEDGNWYLDKYKGTNDIVGIEINVNAGPLGSLNKIDKKISYAPTFPVVLNEKTTIDNANLQNSSKQTDGLLSNLVLGASAADYVVGQCYFMEFCGPCKTWEATGWGAECDCDVDTLEARQCSGHEDDDALSCVGGKLGDHTVVGSVCRVCAKLDQYGYAYAKWIDDPEWEVVGGQCKKIETIQTIENNEQCGDPQCYCNQRGGYQISDGEYCTDDVKQEINSGSCNDRDGCICTIGDDHPIGHGDSCTAEVIVGDGVKSEITSGSCTDIDGCMCNGNPINNGDPCLPIKDNIGNNQMCYDLDGCVCTISGEPSDVLHNEWCHDGIRGSAGSGIECTDYDGCSCPDSSIVSFNVECPEATAETTNEACWENMSNSLVRSDGSTVEQCDDGFWQSASGGIANSCKSFVGGSSTDCPIMWSGIAFCRNLNNGNTYFCNGSVSNWTSGSGWNVDEEIAVELPIIDAGTKCTGSTLACACRNGEDNVVDKDEFCREVAGDQGCSYVYYGSSYPERNGDPTGLVCKKDGTTCTDASTWGCKGPIKVSFNFINKTPLISFSSNEVLGEETGVTEWIIDSQTGMFSNVKEGQYTFEYNGKFYFFSILPETESILVYIDTNGNGKYDKDVDTLVSNLASTVKIVALEQKYTFNLEKGFNFVSFPFLIKNDQSRTAAGLLKNLNEVYDSPISSISKFDGSWKIVGQKVNIYDNDDFQLIPGQGYIIKAVKDITISIIGQPIQYDSEDDSAPISLMEGWNLIGLFGTKTKQYTAKSLIEGINAYTEVDFSADNVSRWQSDVQRYEGYQLTNENGIDIEYGFDYPINTLQSYFVKILSGKGNWQPELSQ